MRRAQRGAAEAGFTLVELMVVLAIIALAAAAVVISVSREDQRLRSEADRLAVRLAAVRDLAVVDGRSAAAVIDDAGYHFEQRLGGQWQPVAGKGFAAHEWADGVRADAAVRIAFSRLGTAAAAQVMLRTDSGAEMVYVARNGEISRAR